jgi:hypothetical protein
MRRRRLMARRQSLAHTATCSDGGDRGLDVVHRLETLGVERAAQVEGETNAARDGVGRRARHLELANGRHQVGLPACPLLDG